MTKITIRDASHEPDEQSIWWGDIPMSAWRTTPRFIELTKDEQRVTRFTSHRNTMKRLAADREARHQDMMTRLGHGDEID